MLVEEQQKLPRPKTYTSHGPEQVGVLIFVYRDKIAAGGNDLHLQHVICCKTVVWCQDGVATSRYKATLRNGFASAAYDSAVVLARYSIHIDHLRSGCGGDGIAGCNLSRSSELELPLMILDVIEVVGPDGKGAWRDGAPKVIMSTTLDN